MDINKIKECVEQIQFRQSQYQHLKNYFLGQHDILAREQVGEKPNNKLVHNFPGYIVRVNTGYFIGKPVAYSYPADEDAMTQAFIEQYERILDYNDEQDHNSDVAEMMGIYGKGFEFLFSDEHHITGEPIVRMTTASPLEAMAVYGGSMIPTMAGFIRRYMGEKIKDLQGKSNQEYFVDVFDDEVIRRYRQVGLSSELTLIDEWPHFFKDVPAVEYWNNSYGQGDFETVISLIDAYNKMGSDSVNDAEEFVDSYLALTGFTGTQEEDVSQMKKNRVLLLEQGDGAKWVTRDINDTAEENRKTRLADDIHLFSSTPNLTDDKFGSNLSGVAIAYKLWGLEQTASIKERKFKKGLQRRIELIANFLSNTGIDFDYAKVDMTFTRNMPQNAKEMAEMVMQLRGLISDMTLRQELPFIDDSRIEQERLDQERDRISFPELDEVEGEA